MSGPPGVSAPSDNTRLFVFAGVAVFTVLCLGFGTSLFSALVVSFAMSDKKPQPTEKIDVGTLALTPPGHPVKLPPLPANISDGPPIPDPPIHRDQCADIQDGGPLGGPEPCVTSEIHCDEMIIGHTIGGVDEYDTTFYEKKFCWPKLIDHDGGDERVYKLVMPPGEWRAWATLHTPCADLDVAAIRYDKPGCPDFNSTIHQCEMKPQSSTRSERIEMTSQTRPGQNAIWYIVVEGKNNHEGPFSLHVQCAPGLSGGY
ncbi:MAG: hypothetical protein H6736_03200 [Alphaproteobacteria bacterium]|nr:hypothetical protein [Alphaproteobacteria bacterium]MCB9690802.1 hypothetical protein [Alphaproteobacteria bacterium]